MTTWDYFKRENRVDSITRQDIMTLRGRNGKKWKKTPKEFKPEDLKGAFVEATKHLKKRKERGKPRLNSGVLVIAMVFLFAILYFLITS